MSDHIERACAICGSLLHHEDKCPQGITPEHVAALLFPVRAELLGVPFEFRVERDNKRPKDGRIFLQATYRAKCTVTGEEKEWRGRKWYLSDHMTEDEIIKTAFAAFEAAVRHEILEGFTVGSRRLFNPHADFRALLKASTTEVYRT
jgi:hypothetical protein